MPDHGFRHIKAAPAGNPRAQPQFRVIGVREEVFVEASHPLQHLAPVHRRAAVGPQHLLAAIILAVVDLAGAPPAVLPIRVNQMTGLVDPPRILVHQDLRRRHAHLGILLECSA